MNIQRLTKECTILWFGFDLWGLRYKEQDDSMQRIQQEITTPLVRGHFKNRDKKGKIACDDSTQ